MIKYRKDEFSRPLIYSTNDEYEMGCRVTNEVVNDIKKLQSTLEEIREYINTHRLFYCEPDEEELFEYVNDLRVKQDLLQIIDKSMEEK